MNWADQQSWETRSQWKERTFALHYGMGPNKLRDLFDQLLNTIEDWDMLGVELPKLIMVPTPNDEGVFVITRMEA